MESNIHEIPAPNMIPAIYYSIHSTHNSITIILFQHLVYMYNVVHMQYYELSWVTRRKAWIRLSNEPLQRNGIMPCLDSVQHTLAFCKSWRILKGRHCMLLYQLYTVKTWKWRIESHSISYVKLLHHVWTVVVNINIEYCMHDCVVIYSCYSTVWYQVELCKSYSTLLYTEIHTF